MKNKTLVKKIYKPGFKSRHPFILLHWDWENLSRNIVFWELPYKTSKGVNTLGVSIISSNFNTFKGGFPGGGCQLILFAKGTGTGTGKKYKFIILKEKSVILFPAGKNRIDFNFFLWTCRKTTGKTCMSQLE